AEMADPSAVNPERHLAIRVAHVVHFDHLFRADPLAARDFQARIADEAVARGLSPRRAAPHLHPVGVIVPDPGVAGRLDADAEPLVAPWALAGAALRIGRRWLVAADVEEVVDRRAAGVEH